MLKVYGFFPIQVNRLELLLMQLTDGQASTHSISASLYNIVLHAVNADNVFSVKGWCKNKFGLEDSAIDKQFSIPGDFDYIN